jgi:hypothetical protein
LANRGRFVDGSLPAIPVNLRRRAVNETADAASPGDLQHIQGTGGVDVMVLQRLTEGAAHTLHSEVENEVASRHRFLDCPSVDNRASYDAHVAAALRLAQI